MSAGRGDRVIVLGGGAAGLAAAYELSRPKLGRRRRPVTLYQSGWRLGGKGASGRGEFDRIEEHGLHVWFGFYRNAFSLLGDAYRKVRDQELGFTTLDEAFRPCDQLGLIAPRPGYEPGAVPNAWDTQCFPLPARAPFEHLSGFRWIPYYFAQLLLHASREAVPSAEDGVDLRPLQDAVRSAARQATDMAVGSKVDVDPSAGPGEIATQLSEHVGEAERPDGAGPPGARGERRWRGGPRQRERPSARELKVDESELLDAADTFHRWERELYRAGEEIERRTADPNVETPKSGPPEVPRYLASLAKRVIALSATIAFPAWVGSQLRRTDLRRRGPFDELNEIDLREALSGEPAPGSSPSPKAKELFERLESIDHWSCDSYVLDSPVVRVLYDLAFAYRGGDRAKPDVGAGVAVENILNIVGRHGGTVMWKMNAGMGDVVFGPLYRALASPRSKPRVRFEFFTAVERIIVGPGGNVEEVVIRRQARVAAGPDAYRPLARGPSVHTHPARGPLPVWPSKPLLGQLDEESREEIAAAEERWRSEGRLRDGENFFRAFEWEANPLDLPDVDSVEILRRGTDFSEVVLAMPPAAIQALTRSSGADLLEFAPDLDAMVQRAQPVATQALQAWFDIPRGPAPAPRLGWPLDCSARPDGNPVLGGYSKRFGTNPCFSPPPGEVEMFDTYCDMDHLLPMESWPGDPPRHLAYFCRVTRLGEDEGHVEADRRAGREAREFLEEHHRLVGADRPFWGEQFAPQYLTDRRPVPAGGWDRVGAQYFRTNSGASELYSTSHVGTVNRRLHADDLRNGAGPGGSRVRNLALAGDWTYTAVNAGSVEAAVISGMEAAAALLGRGGPQPAMPWWREGIRCPLPRWGRRLKERLPWIPT